MQSFFDKRGPRLDTSLPSVRHVQDLIRSRNPVHLSLIGGQELEGSIRWQDNQFLALVQEGGGPLVLVNRDAIVILRALV
jgi:host factor-I protein